jgi:hypothetical protein
MIMTEENLRSRRNLPSPTWNYLGLNPRPCGERLTINSLENSAAIYMLILKKLFKSSVLKLNSTGLAANNSLIVNG